MCGIIDAHGCPVTPTCQPRHQNSRSRPPTNPTRDTVASGQVNVAESFSKLSSRKSVEHRQSSAGTGAKHEDEQQRFQPEAFDWTRSTAATECGDKEIYPWEKVAA